MAGLNDDQRTYWLMVMRPAWTWVSISGTAVSTPGKPQSHFQMSGLVFSSGRWGA